jgi:hypothetical protein
MASNEIPTGPFNVIFALAEDAADGATAHGSAINLQQNTAAAITTDLSAATTAESQFQAARSAKKAASTAVQIADSNAKAYLAAYKKVLSISLGDAWSAEWAAAGFPGPGVVLPVSTDGRLGLLPLAKAYLTANPGKENLGLGVSAVAADAQATALSNARAAVNNANTTAGQKKALRDAAAEKLRQRLIGLVRELDQLIDGDDPRWYAFGLNRPDDPSTPAVPAELVLTNGGPGLVLADWSSARRAERYKVQKMVIGTDTDWVEDQKTTDDEATLTDLPVGATVKVRILAANKAGDSQPGEPAQIVVT